MVKNILILAILIIAFAFTSRQEITLTREQAVATFNVMEVAKKVIPQSDVISAREAVQTISAIDSIQKVISKQYNDTTNKK